MKYSTLLLVSLALASCAKKSEVYDKETAPVAISFIDSISVDSLEQIIYNSMDPGTADGEIAIYTLSDSIVWMCEDGLNIEDTRVLKLVDIYNTSVAVNNIFSDFDLYNRMDFFEEDVAIAIQSVDFNVIRNEQYKDSLEVYRRKMLFLIGKDPGQFDMDVDNPYVYREAMTDLIEAEMLPFYDGIDYEYYDSVYFDNEKVAGLKEYYQKRGDAELVGELKERLEGAKCFEAQCAYAIELAHAYDANHEVARIIPIFESLMNAGKYSIYLFDLWRTWRCIMQPIVGGYSKDSYIPNDKYNEMRRKCAYSTLVYLQNHPEEKIAANQYLVQSACRNIEREGYYRFGNQNAMEEIDLFPERYGFLDEEKEEAEEQ